MNAQLLDALKPITSEEAEILNGTPEVNKTRYTSGSRFIVDSRKLLAKGKLIEIRPHTRFVHFPRHSHNYVEMIYMCQGTCTHIINDTHTVVMEAGDLMLLNQNVTHEILPAGAEDIAVNFIILPEFFTHAVRMLESGSILYNFIISAMSSEQGVSSFLHFRVKDALPVQNIIENMIWTLLHKSEVPETIVQISMGLLFLNLVNFADAIDSRNEDQYDSHLVFSVLKYIEEHYKDGTLEQFCARVHLKEYTVSRILKKHTAMNFKELLAQKKLGQAAWLLTHTKMPAEAIMHAVGYENSSFFYRKFKLQYGMTPKDYRAVHR